MQNIHRRGTIGKPSEGECSIASLRMRVWTLCLLLTGVASAISHAQAIGWQLYT
jgi:hypothetical protein